MTRPWNLTEVRTIRSALAFVLLILIVMDQAPAADSAIEWPRIQNAVFAIRNAHFSSPKVTLDANGRELLAFECETRGRALFGRFHELVCDGGSFAAKNAGQWIGLQVAKSRAFTIELTLTPAEATPNARSVAIAYGDYKGEDFSLLHDKTGLSLRLGDTEPVRLFAPDAGKPVHLLIACDKDKWTAYRDGYPLRTGTMSASTPTWNARELVMGATWSGADPWRGRIENIAVFARALSAEEAAVEASAAKALLTGRKSATTIRFRGTLIRQARTSELKEIHPYTRSLTAAEYKVEKVLDGEWKQPTITVLHWMIMDARRLPIADRKPGVVVELSVGRLNDHPQIEDSRRDEIEDNLGEESFYCEIENP